MEQAIKDSGLSPEMIKKIKAAQKKHKAFDPGCEKLSPDELINWHPVGGISWEERARLMKAAGIEEPNEPDIISIQEEQLISIIT
ncbi:MAG: hypothetical protein LBH16_03560 [Treponema sp.]|jgi:hypothetical protein|nr:hypothetical protein [Treponema sp.]